MFPFRSLAVGNPESIMSTFDNTAQLTEDGVAFTVTVEYQRHACLISSEVLSNLSRSTDKNFDLLATYDAYHAKIQGVARRMVAAGVQGIPVLLTSRNFN
jgi:hypothetical protein